MLFIFSPFESEVIIRIEWLDNIRYIHLSSEKNMYKGIFVQLAFVLFLFGPAGTLKSNTKNTDTDRIAISCGPGIYYSLAELPRIKHPRNQRWVITDK